jgi:hypothetical protein
MPPQNLTLIELVKKIPVGLILALVIIQIFSFIFGKNYEGPMFWGQLISYTIFWVWPTWIVDRFY